LLIDNNLALSSPVRTLHHFEPIVVFPLAFAPGLG